LRRSLLNKRDLDLTEVRHEEVPGDDKSKVLAMLAGTALRFALARLHGRQRRAVVCPHSWLTARAATSHANIQALG